MRRNRRAWVGLGLIDGVGWLYGLYFFFVCVSVFYAVVVSGWVRSGVCLTLTVFLRRVGRVVVPFWSTCGSGFPGHDVPVTEGLDAA